MSSKLGYLKMAASGKSRLFPRFLKEIRENMGGRGALGRALQVYCQRRSRGSFEYSKLEYSESKHRYVVVGLDFKEMLKIRRSTVIANEITFNELKKC